MMGATDASPGGREPQCCRRWSLPASPQAREVRSGAGSLSQRRHPGCSVQGPATTCKSRTAECVGSRVLGTQVEKRAGCGQSRLECTTATCKLLLFLLSIAPRPSQGSSARMCAEAQDCVCLNPSQPSGLGSHRHRCVHRGGDRNRG